MGRPIVMAVTSYQRNAGKQEMDPAKQEPDNQISSRGAKNRNPFMGSGHVISLCFFGLVMP